MMVRGELLSNRGETRGGRMMVREEGEGVDGVGERRVSEKRRGG